MHSIPTLIIGGGTAGASLACALAERGIGDQVTIVDVDLFGAHGSAASSAGGVQCLFGSELDIRLGLASVEFYRKCAAKFGYREQGSLWLCDADSLDRAKGWLEIGKPLGVSGEILSGPEVRARFPVFGDLSDIAAAVLSSPGGYLLPHRLRIHYLNQAQGGGVSVLDHWQVVGIEGARAPFRVSLKRVGPRAVRKVLTDKADAQVDLVIEAERIVNAAGPWAARVAELYGRKLPLQAGPRQMFLLRQAALDLQDLPVVIDGPQDIAFRAAEWDRKTGILVSGEQPSGGTQINFSTRLFSDSVRDRAVRRLPGLEGAEVIRSWVSHDDTSTDGRPIVGAVEGLAGIINFNGLSVRHISAARGLAQSLAQWMVSGRWLAELELDELLESRFAPSALVG